MLPPHIVEREDRKALSLLAFALEQSGVARSNWAAGYDRADIAGPIDNCLCLLKDGGEWLVTYTERGGWNDIGRFPQCADAIKFVYTYLVPGRSPYDYRKTWEARTGQQFSMQE
jgi:hypothetical protein